MSTTQERQKNLTDPGCLQTITLIQGMPVCRDFTASASLVSADFGQNCTFPMINPEPCYVCAVHQGNLDGHAASTMTNAVVNITFDQSCIRSQTDILCDWFFIILFPYINPVLGALLRAVHQAKRGEVSGVVQRQEGAAPGHVPRSAGERARAQSRLRLQDGLHTLPQEVFTRILESKKAASLLFCLMCARKRLVPLCHSF